MSVTDIYYDILEFSRSVFKKLSSIFRTFRGRTKRRSAIDVRGLLKRINIYRRFRERIVSHYLSKTVLVNKKDKDILITWQPLLYVALKIAVGVYAGLVVFGFYPSVARALEQLIRFFRLNEIYNFDIPGPSILNSIGQVVLLVVICPVGISYGAYQLIALFSSFVVNPGRKKAYYIKNILLRKELFIFSLREIDHCILNQNIVGRLFGIGTVELKKKSGYTIRIASLKNASQVMKHLVLATAGAGASR